MIWKFVIFYQKYQDPCQIETSLSYGLKSNAVTQMILKKHRKRHVWVQFAVKKWSKNVEIKTFWTKLPTLSNWYFTSLNPYLVQSCDAKISVLAQFVPGKNWTENITFGLNLGPKCLVSKLRLVGAKIPS